VPQAQSNIVRTGALPCSASSSSENRMLIQALPNRPSFKLWLQDRYGVDLTTVERIQGVLHVMVSEGLGRRERCIERSARCWHK
jgi:hypothetical protein